MSLPDTIFIFALALIIFGPKKLPEIGRQLGRLVGEFRRASNEFKFQIEEELRQADLASNKRPPAQPSIAPPELQNPPSSPAENLPIGQRPNIENLNSEELNTFGVRPFGRETAPGLETPPPTETPAAPPTMSFGEAAPVSTPAPAIAPATGTQARTLPPHVPAASQEPSADSTPLPASPSPVEAEITHG